MSLLKVDFFISFHIKQIKVLTSNLVTLIDQVPVYLAIKIIKCET